MSGLTNFSENLLLQWLLTTDAVTRPTAVYVALHTGDPGEDAASNEVTTAMDSDYVRKVITMATPASGQTASSTAVSFQVNSGSSGYTVTHLSLWDASTGGNPLFKGPLAANRVLAADDIVTFNAGFILAMLD